VAEIDQVRESDPAQFAQWAAAYPERLAKYNEVKGQIAAAEASAGSDSSMREAIAAKARDILAPLRGNAALIERIAMNEYPLTIDGLTKLSADVAAELARSDAAPAQQRQQAAAEQKAKPKALVAGGSGAAGELTFDMVRRMSREEMRAVRATPDRVARIERALATQK
jgi:hypothetical protein